MAIDPRRLIVIFIIAMVPAMAIAVMGQARIQRGWTAVGEALRFTTDRFQADDSTGTNGLIWQFGGNPTISSGFGTGAAIYTGSTDSHGAVAVGSTTSLSGVIGFEAAWASVPLCVASISTQTAGSTRAVGAVASTTTLTLVPESAFAASTTAVWSCLNVR